MPDETPPITIAAALGDAGVHPEIKWKGKPLNLGHPTQVAKSRFCDSLIDMELRSFKEQLSRGIIGEDKYDDKCDRLGSQIDRGEHQPGQPLFMKYTLGREALAGATLFLWSLFAENHPELTFADVSDIKKDCPIEVMLAVKKIVPSFFEWAGAATVEALKLSPEKQAMVKAEVAKLIARLIPDEVPPTPTGTTP